MKLPQGSHLSPSSSDEREEEEDSSSLSNVHSHQNKNKLAKVPEICGLLQSIRIVNAKLSEDEMGNKVIDEQSTRYKSKQSWHLGKWMPYYAEHKNTNNKHVPHGVLSSENKSTDENDDLMSDKYLYSLKPLYLQQVCLIIHY